MSKEIASARLSYYVCVVMTAVWCVIYWLVPIFTRGANVYGEDPAYMVFPALAVFAYLLYVVPSLVRAKMRWIAAVESEKEHDPS